MKKTYANFLVLLLALAAFAACGISETERHELTLQEKKRLWREDSAALKVAVMPTLDCLPAYVAQDRGWFDTLNVRLKVFTAQMDCDTAIQRGRVEGAFTDLVRAERMILQGTPLRYASATNAYWQLITNRKARLTKLSQLDDKMLAMTRYSVTDLLGDLVVDSVKLKTERVFRIQVNDVYVRQKMLQAGIMDALFFTEPQATQGRLLKNPVLLDTRKLDMQMGAIVFSEKALEGKNRERQMQNFVKGYNRACDSLNRLGLHAYDDVIAQHYDISRAAIDSLPRKLNFLPAAQPRVKDIERARAWLKKK